MIKIAYVDGNACDFCLEIEDDSKADLAKELIHAGVDAWYQAADENRENNYFSPDEVDGFYDFGYAEPSMLLLERYGIAFKHCEMAYDREGEPVCDICLAA